MTITPANADELLRLLSDASKRRDKISSIDLSALNRVLAHTPEDMTVTVEAGITLAALQTELARHKQWLPLDPANPGRLTIADLINTSATGPRRCGYGTIRDYLIGLKVALADGTAIHSGGKVVKNVAGYDLAKLFIGSHGSLGVPLEATFKLRPLPELERFVQTRCDSLERAEKLIEAVFESLVTPMVLDLHRLSSGVQTFTLVLGFAGTREEVEWQLERSNALGLNEPSSLDYEAEFRAGPDAPQRLSVLPSRLIAAICDLNGAPFVARAGNGIIYHRGSAVARKEELPLELMLRIKDAYDPAHTFPEIPL